VAPRVIRSFSDGSVLEFDEGKFDPWCVYERSPQGSRRPPLDTDYFETLVEFGAEHGPEKVYMDFVAVYEATGKEVASRAFEVIDEIAAGYGDRELDANKTFSTMYAGMVAEENKSHTRLGKRIKRLGTYVLLVEGRDVKDAAYFMKGMKWQEIDALCKGRGF
jgi:hypothetical protein